jgi:hypothetical protein
MSILPCPQRSYLASRCGIFCWSGNLREGNRLGAVLVGKNLYALSQLWHLGLTVSNWRFLESGFPHFVHLRLGRRITVESPPPRYNRTTLTTYSTRHTGDGFIGHAEYSLMAVTMAYQQARLPCHEVIHSSLKPKRLHSTYRGSRIVAVGQMFFCNDKTHTKSGKESCHAESSSEPGANDSKWQGAFPDPQTRSVTGLRLEHTAPQRTRLS